VAFPVLTVESLETLVLATVKAAFVNAEPLASVAVLNCWPCATVNDQPAFVPRKSLTSTVGVVEAFKVASVVEIVLLPNERFVLSVTDNDSVPLENVTSPVESVSAAFATTVLVPKSPATTINPKTIFFITIRFLSSKLVFKIVNP
jgi:hypothetical protein